MISRLWRKIKSFFTKKEKTIVKHPVDEGGAVDGSPYTYALSQLGVKEIKGARHNPIIQEYLAVAGLKGYSDETAWCAAFVNWCLVKAGKKGTGKANARSFLKLGKETKTPVKGDIVVFWRQSPNSWRGHVGFFVRFDLKGDIVCLGGNQSNSVCYKTYPKGRVLSYRRIV